jgi:outer membrane receptor protein involved in Fe transport
LIVSLGGTLARLSNYRSDNLSNSRAQGGEFAVRIRPVRWISLAGSYTLLASEILSLNGASGVAPRYFGVGQPLIRRPHHSGTMVAAFARGRLSADVTGYFRGKVLDVEPNFGAFGGLFYNPGFANFGVNVNYALPRGVTLYGNLRNALDRHYEEALGFPSPLLNFVSGVKWTFSRSK